MLITFSNVSHRYESFQYIIIYTIILLNYVCLSLLANVVRKSNCNNNIIYIIVSQAKLLDGKRLKF